MLRRDAVREVSGTELEITSFREGDVVGLHELVLNSRRDQLIVVNKSHAEATAEQKNTTQFDQTRFVSIRLTPGPSPSP